MTDDLQITRGFADELRPQVASLYDAAFGAKLGIAIPDAPLRLKLLAQSFDPSHCFIATSGGVVLGVAGFKTSAGALTSGITAKSLRAELRGLKALRAMFVLALFERRLSADQLLMDGISVSPEARGKGIGTQLLNRLKAFAAGEKFRSLRLDVINTNPLARQLYERLGFVATKTENLAYLHWLLGFSATTTLEYRIGAET